MPITYKCPSCGAAMEFNSKYQKLTCTQCGRQMDISDFVEQEETEEGQEAQKQQRTNQQEQQEHQHTDAGNMKVYHCQSCGAELVTDEFTSATICSFCGNPSLVEDRLDGEFTPATIIPFKIDKEQAKDIYRKWAKKGPLTPRELLQNSTIEKITGLYAPFWLYDYAGESQMNATAQRVRREVRGDTEYIYTDHFRIYRDVTADFVKIPADASEKMPDDAMDKLEPFNYGELKAFEMPYLSGYLSERYNYSAQELDNRARQRADQYITDLTRSTIKGYASVAVLDNHITMENAGDEYALFPVWMLNCRYQNKEFSFMLNGQTGKIVADRPISRKRAVAWGLSIFAASLVLMVLGGLVI